MPIQSFAIYGIHAALLFAGLWMIRKWQRSGVLAKLPPGRLWALSALLGGLNFLIAEPLTSPFQDFIEAYYRGGAAVVSGTLDFRELFKSGVHGFVNLPILALAFAPFGLLPGGAAACLFFFLGVGACVCAFGLMRKLAGLSRYQSAILAVLMLTNGPLLNSLKEGNTTHFALLALAWALAGLRKGSGFSSGAVLAVAALFKLPLLLFGVWALLRGHFKAASGGAATLVLLVALSILIFGLEAHELWFDSVVVKAAATPLGSFNVQSFSAALVRASRPDALCSWDGVELAPAWRRLASMAAMALLGISALAIAIAAMRSKGDRERATQVEFCMVALLACATSPLAWSHYYALALLPIAFALSDGWGAPLLRGPWPGRRTWAWASAILVSLPVVWPWCGPKGPLAQAYMIFVSHYLIAAVGLLAILAAMLAVTSSVPRRFTGRDLG